MGENSNECELAYETALWMLFTLVDETMQDGTSVKDEDRLTIDKCTLSLLLFLFEPVVLKTR